jgi:uncharacterized membrane protein YdbT with pleckstrin-like domain
MQCEKCGRQNDLDAVYCKKCGTLLEPEDETRVAERRGPSVAASSPVSVREPAKRAIFAVTPTLKFVYLGYAAAVIAAFALVVLLTAFVPGYAPLAGVVVGILLLFIPAYFHVKQKMIRYTLTGSTIEVDRGLVSRTTQNIPLGRVQDVTVSATVFQRLLGYGDISIDNASEAGGKVVLDNIDSPRKYAELILKQMQQLER